MAVDAEQLLAAFRAGQLRPQSASKIIAECRGEPVYSPGEGRHAGLPLQHEIQKTSKFRL